MSWNVVVSNRAGVRHILKGLKMPTAVISIHDPDKAPEFAQDEEIANVRAILTIPFWDEVDDVYGCMTREQGEQVAAFVMEQAPDVFNFVVNCEGGISRSAGVAAAISSALNDDDFDFFRGRYVPNRVCYRRVLSAIWKLKVGKGASV